MRRSRHRPTPLSDRHEAPDSLPGRLPDRASCRAGRKPRPSAEPSSRHQFAGSARLYKEITGGQGARLVFDPIAGPGVETLAQGIAPGGYLVVYGALDPRTTPLPNAQSFPALNSSTYTLFEITSGPERLARAVAFVKAGLASGAFTPVVDRTFDLTEIAEAHRYMEANGQVGKIVVTVNHDAA
ncbi:zinc-binding dehydrogenase [Streptomyces acidicola]|uniref:zinc-binding dehydrogenase n=1 Tax=Streptomyces acidicola TaxID=2596892 RepID=UPI0037AE77FE